MGNRKQPNPPPVEHVERPTPPPTPPKYVNFPAIDPARVEADEAADRTTKEYGQRLECLGLAVRAMRARNYVSPDHAVWKQHPSIDEEAIDLAEHFREYLNARGEEGDEE